MRAWRRRPIVTKEGENMNRERINTVVIGGGQAGLSVGYHLQRKGV
jgi:cation diffusion facilitator CzcD-associated flavoprotein CzcO